MRLCVCFTTATSYSMGNRKRGVKVTTIRQLVVGIKIERPQNIAVSICPCGVKRPL
jgi:hypothetical protein